MNKTIPQSRKTATADRKTATADRKRNFNFCWDTTTPEGQRDVSAFLMADARRIKRVAPDEARNRMASARALRGQPKLTGTIIPTRIRRILRMPRARARHTQTAKANSTGSDSGGGDPDPEPPRPHPGNRRNSGGAL